VAAHITNVSIGGAPSI